MYILKDSSSMSPSLSTENIRNYHRILFYSCHGVLSANRYTRATGLMLMK